MIVRKRRTVSASALLHSIAADLSQIRAEDGLTWDDMGRVIGKSADQAAKYADASAEMPVTAYLFAQREWGTRLTGRVEAMVSADRHRTADHDVLPDVLTCARGIAQALGDGRICIEDIGTNRKEIEEAINGLQGLLARLDEGAEV